MKKTLALIWVTLSLYSLFLTRHLPFDIQEITQLMSPDALDSQAIYFAMFNLMGIWPFIFAPLIFRSSDHKGHLILWFLTFALGAFVMVPLLISLKTRSIKPNKVSALLAKSYVMIGLILLTSTLTFLALVMGNFTASYELFLSNRFIHIMTLDFMVLNLTFVLHYLSLTGTKGNAFTPLVFLPVIGPTLALYKMSKGD